MFELKNYVNKNKKKKRRRILYYYFKWVKHENSRYFEIFSNRFFKDWLKEISEETLINNRFLIYINKFIEHITKKSININLINQLLLNINFNLFLLYNNVTCHEFSKKKFIYTMCINIEFNSILILKTYY